MREAKPIGIKDHVDDDGLHRIKILLGDEEIAVPFDEAQAIHFVRVFQREFLERREGMGDIPQYPEATVESLYVGHGRPGVAALMVETAQNGTVAFLLTPALIEQLRAQVDLLHSSATRGSN